MRARRAHGYRPTPDDVLALVGVVAAALEGVHQADVVHRDLSPGNFLLRSLRPDATVPGADGPLFTGDEQVLLSDLGLSKDLAAASGLTVGAGTSGFTPPEQRGGGRPVDQRADLWAAGALVVWVALGRPPDDAGRWSGEMVSGGWPAALVTVLQRSLSTEPAKRFATPAAWRGAIALALPPTTAASTGTARRRRPRIAAVAALAGAVLLGAGGALAASAVVGDDGEPDVEQLDDGRVRVSTAEHGAEVAVVGPRRVTVGEPARFAAETTGVDAWLWVTPDGPRVETETLTVTPRSAGTAEIRLVAVTGEGEVVEVTHEFRAEP